MTPPLPDGPGSTDSVRGFPSSTDRGSGPLGLVETLPGASVFHTLAWQRVLERVYDFKHFHLVEPGTDGSAGAVLAVVSSPLTGRRLVSLPFSDSTPFLFDTPEQFRVLFDRACRIGVENRCRYLEIRGPVPLDAAPAHSEFVGHTLDLLPGVDELWRNCSSAIRRGVRKADASGVTVAIRQDSAAMAAYYRLHCRTRQRQGVPPQSWNFFQTVHQELIQTGRGFIALAQTRPAPEAIAGAVFILHSQSAVYKFGASDVRCLELRPNNSVMWQSIRHLIDRGIRNLDFGRTDLAANGLRHFKEGWGAAASPIRYYRFDLARQSFVAAPLNKPGVVSRLFALVLSNTPVPVLRFIGGMAYRHVH